MEVVQTYYLHSTEGFRFDPCRIDASNESTAKEFLEKLQEHTRPAAARIRLKDVNFILAKISEFDTEPHDLTVKLVVQKGNTAVSNDTRRLGGIWANLIFLIRVSEGGLSKWLIYGGGKGRYRKYPLLEIERGKPLGYSYFLSVNQNDKSKAQHFSTLDVLKW